MGSEKNQLSAEYEEFNKRIESAKSEGEVVLALNEFFPVGESVDISENDGELSVEQMEKVTGGHVMRRVERVGVPIFDKPGGKIVGTLNEGDEIWGATATSNKYKQRWFRLTNGNVVNMMHLSTWSSDPYDHRH